MTQDVDSKRDGPLAYDGTELALFAEARNWKQYFAARLRKFISGNVLEVGAGLGNTTEFLCTGNETSWCCLEPDERLVAQINTKIESGLLPPICDTFTGVLGNVDPGKVFDTILYIDVLEHIEQDTRELNAAAELLSPGGYLLVLAPAWECLMSPFDRAIGHFRRYNRRTLEALTPQQLHIVCSFYLDSVGLFVSMGNRFALKSALPTKQQIMFWDKFLIPTSHVFDPITGYRLGKSVVAIWSKTKCERRRS